MISGLSGLLGVSLGAALLAWTMAACSSEGVLGSLQPAAPEAPDAGPLTEGGSDAEDTTAFQPLKPATTSIAAGGTSTCAKTRSGQVRCWGDNRYGTLGNGDIEPPSDGVPSAPTPLPDMVAVFGGERAHCTLSPGGEVYCWGDIFLGDFNGIPIAHAPSAAPFSISGAGDVARVAVGRFFTCLLGPAGDVRCFGINDKGQLGVGDTTVKYYPTTVTGLDAPATSVAASMGGLFACATTHLGSVYCWGDNSAGQISGAPGSVTSPRKIEGLSGRAVEVVAGRAHACARLASGGVTCWGANALGQLGDGTGKGSTLPVEVAYLTDVATLAAGSDHTCAARTEGSVHCWGDDSEGQSSASESGRGKPVLVLPASFEAKNLSCGLAHSCAWGTGGRVKCWGSDQHAQLGPGEDTF